MLSKEDLRIVRTRKLLSDTLLSLMENESIERISVMDLCATAMVNRATFYKHFDDKYDLLSYALERIKRDLYDDFVSKDSTADTPQDTVRAVFATAIDFFFNNRCRVANMLKHNMHGKVIASLEETITNSLTMRLSKYEDEYTVKVPIPMLAKFLSGGLITTLIWCITNPDKYTYDEYLSYTQIGCIDALFIKK